MASKGKGKGHDFRKWDAMKAKLSRAEDAHVQVGILASKGGNDRHDDDELTIAEVAKINEFGAPNHGIPERSFIRSTFRNNEAELKKMTARAAKGYVAGKVSLARALDILGAWGANKIKRTITSGNGVPPPNAAATIQAKGSTRTLVDTGRMLNAISWEVVNAGTEGRGGFRK